MALSVTGSPHEVAAGASPQTRLARMTDVSLKRALCVRTSNMGTKDSVGNDDLQRCSKSEWALAFRIGSQPRPY